MQAKTKLLNKNSEYNNLVEQRDKDNIVVIFQFITMTGLIAIISILLIFTIDKIDRYLDFKTPIPVIPLSNTVSESETAMILARQYIHEIYNIETNLERDAFLRNFVTTNLSDKINGIIKRRDMVKPSLLSYQIEEIHQDYGTSFFNTDKNELVTTSSQYTALLTEYHISKDAKVTSDVVWTELKINLDKNRKFTNIDFRHDGVLIDKQRFKLFLDKLHADNIAINLSFNSQVTPLSLSFMDIKNISFSKLRITTDLDGNSIGQTTLTSNNAVMAATVILSKDGEPVLLLE